MLLHNQVILCPIIILLRLLILGLISLKKDARPTFGVLHLENICLMWKKALNYLELLLVRIGRLKVIINKEVIFMNRGQWFALFALLLQNLPALEMIFKKEEKTDEKKPNE